MPDLDALAPNYRRAQQRWPDAPTPAKSHEALRSCFDTNAHGLVEHVKSFIESVCLTIMGELPEPWTLRVHRGGSMNRAVGARLCCFAQRFLGCCPCVAPGW